MKKILLSACLVIAVCFTTACSKVKTEEDETTATTTSTASTEKSESEESRLDFSFSSENEEDTWEMDGHKISKNELTGFLLPDGRIQINEGNKQYAVVENGDDYWLLKDQAKEPKYIATGKDACLPNYPFLFYIDYEDKLLKKNMETSEEVIYDTDVIEIINKDNYRKEDGIHLIAS